MKSRMNSEMGRGAVKTASVQEMNVKLVYRAKYFANFIGGRSEPISTGDLIWRRGATEMKNRHAHLARRQKRCRMKNIVLDGRKV